ncbi:DUF2793 domain-containing protein [Aurantimonas marina]|uniref:DUF2793 domain-containing protein n=1 Tax=Aurantimonas marina TaxID=2780508 RepID=UPI0019D25DAB|nr:DUF2793 domain-containing protein [Aurantimonas marina]
MENSANLSLPFILPSQAQKHVTHNEALRALDALVMLAVTSRTLSAPPATSAEGERHIVATGGTGAWIGRDGAVAAFQDGAWVFFTPRDGWLAWCADEADLLVYTADTWVSTGATASEFQNIMLLGVNTEADATNRLAVAADATLLSHAGGDHRLVINKQTEADTASLVLQTGFSGRAEIGLAGDDRLSFKTSADGLAFVEAMSLDGLTGKPSFPQANFLEDYAVNLLQDSGRFAGNAVSATTVGAFAFPAYLSLYNGAAAAGLGKFVHNNTDYGGPAGLLAPQVKDLLDMIRDAAYRRYGVEFWVAEITHGAGTEGSLTVGATTGYLNCFSAQMARPPKLTFHAYLRAVDADILLHRFDGQTLYKNGEANTASIAISPADGWVSVTVQDAVDPRTSYGYMPATFGVYAQAQGNRWLLACPALMGGITKIDDDVGVVAAFNAWTA